MAETKTKPTGASVDAYLASRASPEQLADCKAIMAICKRVTQDSTYEHFLAGSFGAGKDMIAERQKDALSALTIK